MTTELRTGTEPLRVSVHVNGPAERAFTVFTAEMATWWPLATHSIEPDQAVTAEMDPRLGGRIVERHRDGTELNWGVITVWEPPHRLVFSWNPSYEDRPETEVEVTFTDVAEGTRVVLEHRGWERLGPAGTAMRRGYAEGWNAILTQRYASMLP